VTRLAAMLEPGQRDRLGQLFDGPAYTPTIAAHVRALEVGLNQAAAEYGANPAALRAAFVRWGLDLAGLPHRPRLTRPRPAPPALPPPHGDGGPHAGGSGGGVLVPLAVGPPSLRARVERVWLRREVGGGQVIVGRQLAGELGASPSKVNAALAALRALRGRDPSLAALRTPLAVIARLDAAELHQAATRARQACAGVLDADQWWQAAVCARPGIDPELFFPDQHHGTDVAGAALARRVCAACPVRPECLRAALASPDADMEGIYAGTGQQERARLRRPVAAPRGRYLTDQAATVAAHQRAALVGVKRAAAEASVARATLTAAFARWGLGPLVPPPPPNRSAVAADRERAHAAWRLACEQGVTAAAGRYQVSAATLQRVFHRFGLPSPSPQARAARRRRHPALQAPPLALAGAFVALNPAAAALAPQRGVDDGLALAARVRRQEEFEALGARVVYGLGEENGRRLPLRWHHVTGRGRGAGWPEAPEAGVLSLPQRDQDQGRERERRCA